MKRFVIAAILNLVIILALSSKALGADVSPSTPHRFSDEVLRLVQAPAPAPGGILMVGSSIFRKWKSCTRDMAPLPVTNRAFGGSQTEDQLYFFDQIVPSSHAALIVWYCGSNDINEKETSGAIIKRTKEWITRTKGALPKAKIVLVSVIKSPQKHESGLPAKVDSVNKGLRQLASSTPGVIFVDVNPALETASGDPRRECYVADKLHLTSEGYKATTSVLRPVFEKEWKAASKEIK